MAKHFARVRVDFVVELDDAQDGGLSLCPVSGRLDLEKTFLPPGRWIAAGLRAFGVHPVRFVRGTKYDVDLCNEHGKHI